MLRNSRKTVVQHEVVLIICLKVFDILSEDTFRALSAMDMSS